MNVTLLERALPQGERVLLDTSDLIAYFDGAERVSPVAKHIMEQFVASGRNPAVVSMVTVMEVLVRPLKQGVGDAYRHVLDLLMRYPNLRLCDIDVFVAHQAASMRASYGFSPVDALIIASGLVSQVGHLVTNDATWRRKLQPIAPRIKVCYLGDYA